VEATGQLHLYGRLRQSVPQPKTSLILAGQVLETQKTAGAPTDPDPVGIQLPYVPTHTGSLTLRHERTHQTRQLLSYFRPTAPDEYAPRRTLTLNADASAVVFSRRTTNASGTETLPAYGLLNAGTSLRYELTGHPVVFNLRLDCLNLLNTEYQSQTNRPMPGRSWQITLGLAYR
jgi:outer membrane receptor protein involved in Fe transport